MSTAVPPTPPPPSPQPPASDKDRRDLLTSLGLGALVGGGGVLLMWALLVMVAR